MAKMNMGAVASKVGGIAAGLAVGGAIQKYLNGTSNPALRNTYGPLAMIVAGAYLPGLMGKSDVLEHAATAIMTKGVNSLMVNNFPSFIAGLDEDAVSGYDDGVSGYATADEVIVSGPYDTDEVSGIGQYIN